MLYSCMQFKLKGWFVSVLMLLVIGGCSTTSKLDELSETQKGRLLIAASAQGNIPQVQALLSSGADVNFTGSQGRTALYQAVSNGRLPAVRELIDAGADVNHKINGRSLLMIVVDRNDLMMAQVLVASGADIAYTAESGVTALSIAKSKKYKDIELLLSHAGGAE